MTKKSILDELMDGNSAKGSTEVDENKILEQLLPEISLIDSEDIKSFVRSILLKAVSFWSIPSSFSGKYHPKDEHGHGGNVLHTKRVVRVAKLLCESYSLSEDESDLIIAATLLHDITKGIASSDSPLGFKYDPMHPYTVNKFVQECLQYDKAYANDMISSTLFIGEDDMQSIMRLVRCHLGPWSPVPETVPITYMDYIVHCADNIASKIHDIIGDSQLINPIWNDSE